ncbi:hypothetical protein ETB97_009350 [Aspergillus alliaceus]|uniref:Uncharacterized protein n=2 Tax=Petromyces alliaceus TaxID=209559 RepID=A0A8H6E0R0_PETAA|nr:hypothetical protein ETB97_009350 [Aspergillus burnettii]
MGFNPVNIRSLNIALVMNTATNVKGPTNDIILSDRDKIRRINPHPIPRVNNNPFNQTKPFVMPNNTFSSSQDSGVTGAAKFVTSTLGNTVGGVSRTVGGVTGAATRGIGNTITGATGSAGKPLGDGLGNIGTGVEDGANRVAKGVENAGQWKS